MCSLCMLKMVYSYGQARHLAKGLFFCKKIGHNQVSSQDTDTMVFRIYYSIIAISNLYQSNNSFLMYF